MNLENYVVKSLELHLFFGRIMKEHSFFLKAGFTPANGDFAEKAEFFKNEFEKFLCRAVELSDGIVTPCVLRSGEIVTEFTAGAEKQTECLTGIQINNDITRKEMNLISSRRRAVNFQMLQRRVQELNRDVLKCLEELIEFKETILENVLHGKMFTANYPLLIEHIIREAKLYCEYLKILEKEGFLNPRMMKNTENFWNQIMMEHAMFIRGLLDPCEKELFCKADGFVKDFEELLEQCRCAQDKTLTGASLEKTLKLRDFKAAGVQGIQQCRIRSIILPLLADHVLREANHYIRLMQC